MEDCICVNAHRILLLGWFCIGLFSTLIVVGFVIIARIIWRKCRDVT